MIAPAQNLDHTAWRALLFSALVIFTTISAQDFADVDGDKLSQRRTIPIIAPIASRWYIFIALTSWSVILTATWRLGPITGGAFLTFGTFVGSRYFRLRDANSDRLSYLFYNVGFLTVLKGPLILT